MSPDHRSNHYTFLDTHFDTILEQMGQAHLISSRGNFSAGGDKYYQYKDLWAAKDIPFFHGAAMYHLMDLLYSHEVRNTPSGWVAPAQWVIDNYRSGHNLSQYMVGMT